MIRRFSGRLPVANHCLGYAIVGYPTMWHKTHFADERNGEAKLTPPAQAVGFQQAERADPVSPKDR